MLGCGIVNSGVRNECDPALALLSDYIMNNSTVMRIGSILGYWCRDTFTISVWNRLKMKLMHLNYGLFTRNVLTSICNFTCKLLPVTFLLTDDFSHICKPQIANTVHYRDELHVTFLYNFLEVLTCCYDGEGISHNVQPVSDVRLPT